MRPQISGASIAPSLIKHSWTGGVPQNINGYRRRQTAVATDAAGEACGKRFADAAAGKAERGALTGGIWGTPADYQRRPASFPSAPSLLRMQPATCGGARLARFQGGANFQPSGG